MIALTLKTNVKNTFNFGSFGCRFQLQQLMLSLLFLLKVRDLDDWVNHMSVSEVM